MESLIQQLHHRQWVWHGSHYHAHQVPQQNKLATGYSELDKVLAGGFPATGVVEINSQIGVGELRLTLPSLTLTKQQLVVFVSPPASINAQALTHFDIEPKQVMVLRPQQHKDALWAVEQCLQSGCCNTLCYWPANTLTVAQVKRFQFASKASNSRLFTFTSKATAQNLPLELSLTLRPQNQGLTVKINRRKGGWPTAFFSVNMRSKWPYCTLDDLPASNVIAFPTEQAS